MEGPSCYGGGDAKPEFWVWLEPSVRCGSQPLDMVNNNNNAGNVAGRAAWQLLLLPFQGQAEEGAADHSSSASMPDGCHR